jgi:predicted transcriptional regulator
MLSVRLSPPIEEKLKAYCKQMHLTKSQVVQEAAAQWLSTATKQRPADAESDLSFFSR